jgi:hypothetical protein
MKQYLFYIGLFISITAKCQTTKVLIIDTVIGPQSEFSFFIAEPYTPDGSTYLDGSGNHIIYKATLNPNKHPAVVLTIKAKIDTANLILPIDDSGGNFVIHNAFITKSDTILISKFTVFHNCLPDSIESGISWFRYEPSDTSCQTRLLKTNSKTIAVEKNSNEKYPGKYSITVNGQFYNIPIEISPSPTEIKIYHGHKKMSRKKAEKWENARIDGKPYKYFVYGIIRRKYMLSAVLSL